MSATNGTGYEVQVLLPRPAGWTMESEGYASLDVAREALKLMPEDGLERRAYESLEGW